MGGRGGVGVAKRFRKLRAVITTLLLASSRVSSGFTLLMCFHLLQFNINM